MLIFLNSKLFKKINIVIFYKKLNLFTFLLVHFLYWRKTNPNRAFEIIVKATRPANLIKRSHLVGKPIMN